MGVIGVSIASLFDRFKGIERAFVDLKGNNNNLSANFFFQNLALAVKSGAFLRPLLASVSSRRISALTSCSVSHKKRGPVWFGTFENPHFLTGDF